MRFASTFVTSPSSKTPGQRVRVSRLHALSTSQETYPTIWQSNLANATIIAPMPSNSEMTSTRGPDFVRSIEQLPAGVKDTFSRSGPFSSKLLSVMSPSGVSPALAHSPPPCSEASEHVTSPLTGVNRLLTAIGSTPIAAISSSIVLCDKGRHTTALCFGQARFRMDIRGRLNSNALVSRPKIIISTFWRQSFL